MLTHANITGPVGYLNALGERANLPQGPCKIEDSGRRGYCRITLCNAGGVQLSFNLPLHTLKLEKKRGHIVFELAAEPPQVIPLPAPALSRVESLHRARLAFHAADMAFTTAIRNAGNFDAAAFAKLPEIRRMSKAAYAEFLSLCEPARENRVEVAN